MVSNVDHAMESFHVDLAGACEGLGTTEEGLSGGKEAAGVKIFTTFYEVAFSHRGM